MCAVEFRRLRGLVGGVCGGCGEFRGVCVNKGSVCVWGLVWAVGSNVFITYPTFVYKFFIYLLFFFLLEIWR